LAITEIEAQFIATSTGDSDLWPDHEKHVYHLIMDRRDASEYLYNDSNGESRIQDHIGMVEFSGQHADNVSQRVYVFVGTDEGTSPTINDPHNCINLGLGD